MGKLCFATNNHHKFLEVEPIAREHGIELEMCRDVKIEIQSDSLEEIVVKSAMLAYIILNRPVLVEDAGLFVEALNGFPGPYSNFVYRTIGISGLLKLMRDLENRRAYFKSAAAIAFNGGILVSTGVVEGEIARESRGSRGFGFDPIFIPRGDMRTFAEMSVEEKNRVSHRATSTRKVLKLYVDAIKRSQRLF